MYHISKRSIFSFLAAVSLVVVIHGYNLIDVLASVSTSNYTMGVVATQATGEWVPTGSLTDSRLEHTATRLADGRVLVVGGVPGWINGISALTTTEIYDPASGTWSLTDSLNNTRLNHTATLLPNGRVLVAGGIGKWNDISATPLTSTEIYDPASETWSAAAPLTVPRQGHTATRLSDGRVLVVGGYYATDAVTASAEIYDPVSNTWSSTGSLNTPRLAHKAALLPDGRVLVVDGYYLSWLLGNAEIYDPVSGVWSETPALPSCHGVWHTMTPLLDGRVLVVGGGCAGGVPGITAAVDIYNPATSIWEATTDLSATSEAHAATLLPDGRVLVAGGDNGDAPRYDSVLLYDPDDETWTPIDSLDTRRRGHTVTLLEDGRVLVAGGAGDDMTIPLDSAELFTVSNLSIWHVAVDGSDVTGDGSETNPFATIQHGIDMASDGNTVLVHPGVYTENINFNGKNITVGSLFITTGDDSYITQTVIDGNRNGRGVTFENGEDATAILSGFTVTNGYVQGANLAGQGGGIACLSSSPTLMNLNVSGNEAANGGTGGGIFFDHSSSSLRNTTITSNTSDGGGGMRYTYGSPSIENVIVSGNSAGYGGGIIFYHADATVKNVLIANNVANGAVGSQGGGLYFDGSSPNFVNVTIVGNSTSGGGGGLHVSYSSHPSLVNSIVWGNSPDQIYFDTYWPGEAITIDYSDIQLGCTGIITNGQGPVHCGVDVIDANPLFVDAGNGDYHLSDYSPGLGMGTLDNAPSTDIEGNPRPNPAGSNPDMGTYENPLDTMITLKLTINPPTSTFMDDLVYIPVELNNVHSVHDLRGVQFSLKVTDTAILSLTTHLSPTLGSFFPTNSTFSATPTGDGWDFLLTDFVSTPAVNGTGVVVNLPFTAINEGCVTLTFNDHQLSDGSAQLIPHTADEADLCVLGTGDVQGNIYLDWRGSGHYTDTHVMLIGSQKIYTTTTDANGSFTFTNTLAGTYTLQAGHPLFVPAQRTITVSSALTTTVPSLGLWAGDIDQDQDVDLYDWYLQAAAIYPVSHPDFDINDDRLTNIQDLVILDGNRGQPNMTTTNPPLRPGLTSHNTDRTVVVQNVGKLKLVSLSDEEMILYVEDVSEPIYAIGVRLSLPMGTTVTAVEVSPALSGGFLKWHQDGQKLYIVTAPLEGGSISQDTNVVIIHGVAFDKGKIAIEAKNNVSGLSLDNTVFLPVIIK